MDVDDKDTALFPVWEPTSQDDKAGANPDADDPERFAFHDMTQPVELIAKRMLATTVAWPTALAPQPAAPTNAVATIGKGLVHVEPNWLSPRLIRAMRLDAQDLFAKGLFAPDGLTNTALKKQQQQKMVKKQHQQLKVIKKMAMKKKPLKKKNNQLIIVKTPRYDLKKICFYL